MALYQFINRTTLLFCFWLVLNFRVVSRPIPDDVLHYYAGFLIGITAGHLTFHYSTHERWDVSLGAASASAAMAGYAKEEFYDGTLNRGTKSKTDFIATVHGGLGSVVVCCVSFNIHEKRKHPEIFEEDFDF